METSAENGLQGYALAEHWLEVGQAKRALETLEQADPDDARTWRLRASALHAAEDNERLVAAAQEGLRIEPEDTYLMRLLAHAHIETGQPSRGERVLRNAIEIDPHFVGLWCDLAELYTDQNRPGRAREALDEALRIAHPENIEVKMTAAYFAAKQKRWDDAQRITEEVLRLDPDNAHAQVMLGAWKAERGGMWPNQWARHFETAARSEPSNTDVVDAAREARAVTHWLMVPLWPIHRFGWVTIWISGIVIGQIIRHAGNDTQAVVWVSFWLSYCVYSWVMPYALRRWLARGTR